CDPRPPQISRLSLHDALPIWIIGRPLASVIPGQVVVAAILVVLAIGLVVLVVVTHHVAQGETVMGGDEVDRGVGTTAALIEMIRSEEHTSELQSRENLVCRLL